MKREGRSGVLELGLESNMKGDGNSGAGGVKLLRSSKKNREGGGNSVSTSSMSRLDYYFRFIIHARKTEKVRIFLIW